MKTTLITIFILIVIGSSAWSAEPKFYLSDRQIDDVLSLTKAELRDHDVREFLEIRSRFDVDPELARAHVRDLDWGRRGKIPRTLKQKGYDDDQINAWSDCVNDMILGVVVSLPMGSIKPIIGNDASWSESIGKICSLRHFNVVVE